MQSGQPGAMQAKEETLDMKHKARLTKEGTAKHSHLDLQPAELLQHT